MSTTIITDEEIKNSQRITVQVAALYLGISVRNLQDGLKSNAFPFGLALKKKEWVFHIFPERLVAYKHGYDLLSSAS